MNKWLLYAFCFLPLGIRAETSTEPSELMQIERQIQMLKKHLQQGRLEEIKEEVEGQRDMIADWGAYAHELEKVRQHQEEEHRIEKQIKKLEERKTQLLKQQQQTD
jgi:DNA repair exonuclease SbcCD ATPase subunit